MPKIPYTPEPRGPRLPFYVPPDPPCPICEGEGVLYRNSPDRSKPKLGDPVECWVCKGSGKTLPPPPEGLTGNAAFDNVPWSGDGGSNDPSRAKRGLV